ncbi:MAG: sensor histidine kinase [Lachnospiraceae bacterium]|jgi:two-component system sensor histidine kinase YesM|nr:sensor histidine kinase [Lachnospiraceae bacterium]
MNMKKIPITFRKRMILYNLLMIVCIACIISIYTYSFYKKDAIVSETASSANRLHLLSSRLEIACDELINIVQNCAGRKSLFLTSILSGREHRSNEEFGIYAAEVLKDLCAISGYNEYIHKIIVYEKNSLFIQAGTSYGSWNDAECIMSAPWFHELLNKNMREYTLTLKNNPFPLNAKTMPQILPLIRPLQYSKKESPEDAWIFLSLSPKLFQNTLELLPRDKSIMIMTSDFFPVSSMNMESFAAEEITNLLASPLEQTGSLRVRLSETDCILTWERLPVSGLILCEVLPLKHISPNPNAIRATVGLVFLSCIAIGFFLSLLFTRYLTRPIMRLIEHMEVISSGDFSRNPDIESNDELGIIGRQINEMSSHVSVLMENRIRDEKEKKNLEIKMLQAQINPHFLYNTLDSIKWIATMQHNSGIVRVVSALSSLLKNMAKGFNEKVTIRQELDFLDNYITIEKIRYIELFDVEISVEDKELYNACIVKLTLQPLVENSIFSGIEPSGKPGLIQIHIFSKDQVLYISIRDNGIGISEENISQMLTDTSRVTKHYMSGIGLPNVDRRIKLVYGQEYGLTIDSEVGVYTCVTVSLPLELKDCDEGVSYVPNHSD